MVNFCVDKKGSNRYRKPTPEIHIWFCKQTIARTRIEVVTP